AWRRLRDLCFPATPSPISGTRPASSDSDSARGCVSIDEKEGGVRSNMAKASKFLRETMLFSWLNILLVFVPVGLCLYLSGASPVLVFVFNGIAIIPLSSLLTGATERIADDAGDTIGAFLNISLGNIVELILLTTTDLTSVALKHNQIHVVQASILGSILVNLLLILGTALCVNGLWHDLPVLNVAETQLLSGLLFVSVFVFLIPAAFHHTFSGAEGASAAILKMSRASALIVIFIYILYFVHEFRTHSITQGYHSSPKDSSDLESSPTSPARHSGGARQSLEALIPLRSIHHANRDTESRREEEEVEMKQYEAQYDDDDDFVSSGSESGKPEENSNRTHWNRREDGERVTSDDPLTQSTRSLPFSTAANPRRPHQHVPSTGARHQRKPKRGLANSRLFRRTREGVDDIGAEQTRPDRTILERLLPIFVLIISSALMSMCAEFLVSTIDEVTHQGHLSETVIGLIILPIIGNVAEYVTVVTVAAREKLDLAVAVAVGSSIQIALCVAPLTVIASWILSRELILDFNLFEVAALMGTALLVSLFISGDGNGVLRAGSLKGGIMCACYMIIGLGAYLSPEVDG
ncbi:sodium calcium, partial [Colletotrichum truncatum]